MANNETIIQRQISIRKAKISALLLLAVALLSLSQSIYVCFKGGFLKLGSAFNTDMVNDMRRIIMTADFIVMPALSILLIMSSRLIWTLSKKLDESERDKVTVSAKK